jgi:hypothetical protein
VKRLLIIILLLPSGWLLKAQFANCTFKPPFYTINFGTGDNSDLNEITFSHYEQVFGPCPTDGHYSYASSTGDCFRGDWHNLTEDHTAGDQDGNMMLVNASYYTGPFLSTTISGFKGGTTYQFGAWMMDLCRITDKCPFLLLPNITIRLQTPEGKLIVEFTTGELQRLPAPTWKQYRGLFTMPPSTTTLKLTMIDLAPGGCGNDFALDDITFQECVQAHPVVTAKPKVSKEKQQPPTKQAAKKKEATASAKSQPNQNTIKKPPTTVTEPTSSETKPTPAISKPTLPVLPPPPTVLTKRTNPLVKQIETAPGEIKIDLYDNGEIDGDTISVYHNNQLVIAHAGLSEKPITFYIKADAAHPHHELVMVANNLGLIPPNTSLMIVTAGGKRYEVFISSSEQKNAKVNIDLSND